VDELFLYSDTYTIHANNLTPYLFLFELLTKSMCFVVQTQESGGQWASEGGEKCVCRLSVGMYIIAKL